MEVNNLTEKWRTVKLLDIGKIVTGNTPSTKNEEYYNSNDFMFIKPDDLQENTLNSINSSKAYISALGSEKSRKVPAGSILVTCIGTIGKVAFVERETCFNQQSNAIIPDTSIIDSKFLGYTILKYNYLLKAVANAPIVPIINKTQFSNIEIMIPPLETQKKIVEILEKAEKALEKRKEAIKLLDELVKSQFIEMFGDPVSNPKGWKIKKLKDISLKISDGVHAKPNYTREGKPFISVVNITKGYVNFTNCKHVSEEDYQKMIKSTHPEIGDILYTKVGATYGIPAYIDVEKDFCLYVSVCLIKPNHEKIDSRFLALSMGMQYVKFQADRRIRGIGVPDLHLNQIREFDICCPPRELQIKFVDFVNQVDKLKFEMQKSLKEMENNFNSLMQRAFKGELFN